MLIDKNMFSSNFYVAGHKVAALLKIHGNANNEDTVKLLLNQYLEAIYKIRLQSLITNNNNFNESSLLSLIEPIACA